MTRCPGDVDRSPGELMAEVGAVWSVDGATGDQPRLERRRLDAHVGEQVDHRLLHARIGRRRLVVVIVAQTPGPVDRAGAEDQRTARRAIKRQVVGRDAVAGRVAVVEQIRADRKRRRGELDQAGGIEAVVGRFVPLIAEIVLGQRRRLAGLKIGDAGVAPEAQVGVVVGNLDRLEVARRRRRPGRSVR